MVNEVGAEDGEYITQKGEAKKRHHQQMIKGVTQVQWLCHGGCPYTCSSFVRDVGKLRELAGLESGS